MARALRSRGAPINYNENELAKTGSGTKKAAPKKAAPKKAAPKKAAPKKAAPKKAAPKKAAPKKAAAKKAAPKKAQAKKAPAKDVLNKTRSGRVGKGKAKAKTPSPEPESIPETEDEEEEEEEPVFDVEMEDEKEQEEPADELHTAEEMEEDGQEPEALVQDFLVEEVQVLEQEEEAPVAPPEAEYAPTPGSRRMPDLMHFTSPCADLTTQDVDRYADTILIGAKYVGLGMAAALDFNERRLETPFPPSFERRAYPEPQGYYPSDDIKERVQKKLAEAKEFREILTLRDSNNAERTRDSGSPERTTATSEALVSVQELFNFVVELKKDFGNPDAEPQIEQDRETHQMNTEYIAVPHWDFDTIASNLSFTHPCPNLTLDNASKYVDSVLKGTQALGSSLVKAINFDENPIQGREGIALEDFLDYKGIMNRVTKKTLEVIKHRASIIPSADEDESAIGIRELRDEVSQRDDLDIFEVIDMVQWLFKYMVQFKKDLRSMSAYHPEDGDVETDKDDYAKVHSLFLTFTRPCPDLSPGNATNYADTLLEQVETAGRFLQKHLSFNRDQGYLQALVLSQNLSPPPGQSFPRPIGQGHTMTMEDVIRRTKEKLAEAMKYREDLTRLHPHTIVMTEDETVEGMERDYVYEKGNTVVEAIVQMERLHRFMTVFREGLFVLNQMETVEREGEMEGVEEVAESEVETELADKLSDIPSSALNEAQIEFHAEMKRWDREDDDEPEEPEEYDDRQEAFYNQSPPPRTDIPTSSHSSQSDKENNSQSAAPVQATQRVPTAVMVAEEDEIFDDLEFPEERPGPVSYPARTTQTDADQASSSSRSSSAGTRQQKAGATKSRGVPGGKVQPPAIDVGSSTEIDDTDPDDGDIGRTDKKNGKLDQQSFQSIGSQDTVVSQTLPDDRIIGRIGKDNGKLDP